MGLILGILIWPSVVNLTISDGAKQKIRGKMSKVLKLVYEQILGLGGGCKLCWQPNLAFGYKINSPPDGILEKNEAKSPMPLN